jgi:hypothetical protein
MAKTILGLVDLELVSDTAIEGDNCTVLDLVPRMKPRVNHLPTKPELQSQ